MPAYANISLRQYPILRITIALITGIVTQWYFSIPGKQIIIYSVITLLLLLVFQFVPESKKFILAWLRGLLILLLFVCFGLMNTWLQNIHNNYNWYGKIYKQNDIILATIQEPLVIKTNSYKALASINAVYENNTWANATGNVLLYFKKDSVKPVLHYGSQLIFNKPIQQIQNSGNPVAFNYNRYCLFQNITGQTFLASNDYKILSSVKKNLIQSSLFNVRDWALHVLQQNIHSQKELGIAEALLIGYRNDLDKDLVQAYSNTGVVHIIAISGLHIGVIYAALLSFFSLFKSSKLKMWLEPIIILLIIWMFTLVAGAAPSVLRASVMFTFLLAGKFLDRKGNMYNTLAASALVLLLFNPFYLWDVGFQLSYSAVFSIILFYKKISGSLYFKNKTLRWLWQLCAVSLSAQIFTLPLVIYHFHQLPILFLFSNLVAVPLSGIILFEELILFFLSWWHAAATFVGWVTEKCVLLMNDFIEHINKLSFSVWDGLQISIIELLIIFIIIFFFSFWIFTKKTRSLIKGIAFTALIFVLRDIDVIYHRRQQKIIVYNVPKQKAIDIIAGNTLRFAGDSNVIQDAFLRNFNLRSAHIKNKVFSNQRILLPDIENFILNVNSSKILLLGNESFYSNNQQRIPVDVLILSKNTQQTPEQINNLFQCNYIVADSDVPIWKSARWKKEFEQLHLRFFSVAQDGAFTLKL